MDVLDGASVPGVPKMAGFDYTAQCPRCRNENPSASTPHWWAPRDALEDMTDSGAHHNSMQHLPLTRHPLIPTRLRGLLRLPSA